MGKLWQFSRTSGNEIPTTFKICHKGQVSGNLLAPTSNMIGFPSASKVQICGVNKHDCGYCKDSANEGEKRKDTSVSYGFVASSMAVEDYQSLMLTGWRRSGTYFYKPIMHKTCCPQYTIRLRVNDFRMSKSQKKVMKNVTKFLCEGSDDSTFSTEDNLKISPMFTFTSTSATDAQSGPTTPTTRGIQTLTAELEPSSFTTEKYELYRRYQVDVHHDKPDELSEQGFRRFLVESPLKDTTNAANPQFGSFHQLYRLNGALIAVGVIDLLPLGLSSVYMFYDNNYKHLSLGKYTALREIEYCKTHNLEYYFMGFYIHTCEKMRYKGEYKPSELLCPTSLQWYPLIPHCSNILDQFNFSPFEPTLAKRRAAIDVDVGDRKVPKTEATEGGVDKVSLNTVDDAPSTATDATDAKSTPAIGGGTTDELMTVAEKVVESGDERDEEEQDENENEDSQEEEGSDTELEASVLDEFAPMYFSHVSINQTKTDTKIDGNSTAPAPTNTNTSHAATSNGTVAAVSQAIRTVPLDIGVGRPIVLTDLRPDSVTHLQPFLQEWISYVGPVNGAKITVSLV